MLMSNLSSESEARSHQRHAVHNFVSYRYGGNRFLTVALNLGVDGIRIFTYHFLPKEEQLDIQLVLGRNSIWLKGRSVYCQLISEGQYISGLQFVEVLEQDRNFLENYLRHKELEEVLQECDKTYRTLFKEMREAICITTRQGEFVDLNQSALDLLGFTREEMMRTNVREIYAHPLDRTRFQQEMEKKGFLRDYEVRFRRKDGRELDCLVTATLWCDGDGNILGYQGIVRDNTKRKREEEEIKKLNEELTRRTVELQAINKELEAFNCFVSHELHTPLVMIGGFSRILLLKYSDHLDAKAQQFLNIIQVSIQNMIQLIDDLLTISHLGHPEMKSSDISMSDLAKTVSEELMLIAPERRLQFNIKILPPAHGDQTMIRQVFVNLLSNAIKFTRPKGAAVIEIGGRTEEDKNVYYIKDNGVGFDMRGANKLFNAFGRLHSREEFEGTGIGLAIVHRIIDLYRGQVWAEGKVNEGATFYFTLPRGGEKRDEYRWDKKMNQPLDRL